MITFDAAGIWNATGTTSYSRFPMWGETAAAQAITPATSLGNITLLRALARIDVGCALSGETAAGLSGFTLKTVSVYRTKNKGYAAPVNGGTITGNVVASVSIPPDAGTNGALTYTCPDGKSLIRTIYVAETPQGSRDNNVCLVVGGTYCGKHALLQGRPHQRGKLYSAEKELPLHREYQGGKQYRICHGSSSTYGRQDAGNSNKRIGRSLERTDSSRVGNDNHASKPGSMVADAEMPGSTGTIILL